MKLGSGNKQAKSIKQVFFVFFSTLKTQTLSAVWQRSDPRLRRRLPRVLAPDWTCSGCGSCGSQRWPTCFSFSSFSASALCAVRTTGCGEEERWEVQSRVHTVESVDNRVISVYQGSSTFWKLRATSLLLGQTKGDHFTPFS